MQKTTAVMKPNRQLLRGKCTHKDDPPFHGTFGKSGWSANPNRPFASSPTPQLRSGTEQPLDQVI